MRHFTAYILILSCAFWLSGCTPQSLNAQTGDDLLNIIAGAGDAATASDDSSTGQSAAGNVQVLKGNVTGSGNYKLYKLGAGRRGDCWEIVPDGALGSPFVVVLFDSQMNLLMRTYLSYHGALSHVLRAGTDEVYLGIMPPTQMEGGDFRLKTVFRTAQSVPGPARQTVYLNFGVGRNVRVHTRDPISFAPFDAAVIGNAYAGYTAAMKDVIYREMLADYTAYDIQILSSDDGPPPEGNFSTIHFGGKEPGLLGLADNVDNYNVNKTQTAVVYVENFAPYWTMGLTPEEMAIMIANVASHELGHLLGLYHTQDPADLMDTTGSAWDLAANQSFLRGRLERSVFATGYEDSPRLLTQILGSNKTSDSSKSLSWRQLDSYKALRKMVHDELEYQCGICQCLDCE